MKHQAAPVQANVRDVISTQATTGPFHSVSILRTLFARIVILRHVPACSARNGVGGLQAKVHRPFGNGCNLFNTQSRACRSGLWISDALTVHRHAEPDARNLMASTDSFVTVMLVFKFGDLGNRRFDFTKRLVFGHPVPDQDCEFDPIRGVLLFMIAHTDLIVFEVPLIIE